MKDSATGDPGGAGVAQSPCSTADLIAIIEAQAEIVELGVDLGAVMAAAVEAAARIAGVEGAAVEFLEGEDLVYRAAAGMAANQLGLRLSREGSLSGLCIEAGTPLVCDDPETDERVNLAACRTLGLRSMAVAPLKHAGECAGVLKLMSAHPAAFGPRELEIQRLFCGAVAAAMFHASRLQSDDLYHRATHDALTGLANRALFYDRLRHALTVSRRHGGGVAVIMMDMDGLKSVNDTLGHRAGDEVLREFGRRLAKAARATDTVARVGGDEFAVLLHGVLATSEAEAMVRRIEAALVTPVELVNRSLQLSASLGVALSAKGGEDADGLVEAADQAMYERKRSRWAAAGAEDQSRHVRRDNVRLLRVGAR